jgi:hypothetical protein
MVGRLVNIAGIVNDNFLFIIHYYVFVLTYIFKRTLLVL